MICHFCAKRFNTLAFHCSVFLWSMYYNPVLTAIIFIFKIAQIWQRTIQAVLSPFDMFHQFLVFTVVWLIWSGQRVPHNFVYFWYKQIFQATLILPESIFYHFPKDPWLLWSNQFSAIAQSVSKSLRPHWLQHTRLPGTSPTPRACSNSRPLSWWCHQTISSSVVPFSSSLQSFPASDSFLMSQLFTSDDWNIKASLSFLPMNIQDWLVWSPCSPRDSQVFCNTTV